MIIYFDTSALIKHYIQETDTDIVDEAWGSDSMAATSVVAYAETIATLSRKYRDKQLSELEYSNCLKQVNDDFSHFILVPIDNDLNKNIAQLVSKYPLKGFDAIHLASALILTQLSIPGVKFLCFDKQLSFAAQQEGLAVF